MTLSNSEDEKSRHIFDTFENWFHQVSPERGSNHYSTASIA